MTMPAEKKPERLTSSDVQACIQRHFGSGGEQYAVLFEVRNGTAWRANRSVDAVVMGLWPSLGMRLTGMEIKVGRGDWMREYRNPAKASEAFDYFDHWYLVAPADVAKIEEIPEPWGWFVPENGKLRKVRDAAKNPNVKAVDRHFLGALLRRVAKTDDAFIQSAVSEALKAQRATYEADAEKRVLERLGETRKDAEQWAQVRDLLKGKPDDFIYQPDVIEALRVLVKCGVAKSYGSLRSLISEIDRTREGLLKVADDLGIPKEPQPSHRLRKRA